MNLSDLDSLVQRLKEIQEKSREKKKEHGKAMKSAQQIGRETERLKKLSLISGKSFSLKDASEEANIAHIEAEISQLKTDEMEIEKKIAEGISEVKFPIKSSKPEISEGNAIFCFEEGAHENAIEYLKLTLSMKKQLEIDDVVFTADKIVVRGKSKADEATDCLMNAVQSVWALGSIMLGKVSEEMKKTIDFLVKSKYKHLWEFIGSRGSISVQNSYENFGLTDASEKKRTRTFYSQLESLRTPPLARGDGKGNFQLTMYGRLVWASYKKAHAVSEGEAAEQVQEAKEMEETQPRETTKKPSQTALQNFMEQVLLDEGN